MEKKFLGKIVIVSSVDFQPYKTWPIKDYSNNSVFRISDLSKFRFLNIYWKTATTFKKINLSKNQDTLKRLKIFEDERIFSINKTLNLDRKWNQLGFGSTFRTTLAIGIINGYKIFSIPFYGNPYLNTIFRNPYWIEIWEYLMENNFIILVDSRESEWVNKFKYGVE